MNFGTKRAKSQFAELQFFILDAYYFRSVRQPELEITEYVDFGIVVSKCRVETREIFIFNRGALEGTFHISCCDNQLLTFDPYSGKVPPRSAQCIKVGSHCICVCGSPAQLQHLLVSRGMFYCMTLLLKVKNLLKKQTAFFSSSSEYL